MDLTVGFGVKEITTPVYIKMDAEDQLLLSEGLCRQLALVTYHPEVVVTAAPGNSPARVPIVRVKLVDSVCLLPKQSTLARVELERSCNLGGTVLLEASSESVDADTIQLEGSLICEPEDGLARVMLSNPTSFAQKLKVQ